MRRGHDLVFYDGGCGLCHRAVKFAMERDPDGSRFRFAPLHGETYDAAISEERRRGLPESVIVLTPRGRLLTHWRAVDRLLMRIGGGWARVAGVIRLVPPPLTYLAYEFVASIRHWLFEKPEGACPVGARECRERFLG